MTTMPANPSVARRPRDWRRPLRYLWRIPFLVLHLGVALPFTVLMINPLSARIELRGERLDHRIIRWWQGGLMRVFGFRLRRYGTPLPGAVMFVANHVSWIDIELMHSQRMMGFVAKAEIARWPLVGWLASRGGTIYHHRGSNDSLHGVMHQMVQRLEAGQAVGVFPEGRTTRGDAIAVSATPGGMEQVLIEGTTLAPGRWYGDHITRPPAPTNRRKVERLAVLPQRMVPRRRVVRRIQNRLRVERLHGSPSAT